MVIKRNHSEIRNAAINGGVYEINLTPEELLGAYRQYIRNAYAEEVNTYLSEKIEAAGMTDHYDRDLRIKDLAYEVAGVILETENSEPCLNEEGLWFMQDIVDEKLKEAGIDPVTLKKI